MSLSVFCTVLFAAALHAGWNSIVKGADNKLFTTILVATAAALFAGLIVPFVPLPTVHDWFLIATSCAVHVAYYILVANAYRLADMSQSYPLMRGTAPLLVAIASVTWFGEALSLTAWSGILLISFGIISLAWTTSRGGNGKGAAVALLNAVVIAAYTLLDATGVRHAVSPLSYMMWLFLLTPLPLLAWVLIARRKPFLAYAREHAGFSAIGGVISVVSYGLVLWMMTIAPVAMVAALRETSILFAMAIAAVILHERLSIHRIMVVCVIGAGAMLLRIT